MSNRSFRRGGRQSSFETFFDRARETRWIAGRRFRNVATFVCGDFSERALSEDGSWIGKCNVGRRDILIIAVLNQ